MALTTAGTDSPSKLKVAAPLVPPRRGGGALAAPRLITWPVPRRITGVGPFSSGGNRSAWAAPAVPDVPGAGTTAGVGLRWITALGSLAQAARMPARTASNRARKVGRFMRLLGWRAAGRLPLGFAAQLRAPLLDAFADRVHLL